MTVHWKVLGRKFGRALICGVVVAIGWSLLDAYFGHRPKALWLAYFSAAMMGAWLAREDEKSITFGAKPQ